MPGQQDHEAGNDENEACCHDDPGWRAESGRAGRQQSKAQRDRVTAKRYDDQAPGEPGAPAERFRVTGQDELSWSKCSALGRQVIPGGVLRLSNADAK